MRTLTVTERTKLVKQLANLDYLESDILLFRDKFPRSKLNNELLRINKYNATRLHGQLLYELLSSVSAEDVKKNRKASAPTAAAPEGETDDAGGEGGNTDAPEDASTDAGGEGGNTDAPEDTSTETGEGANTNAPDDTSTDAVVEGAKTDAPEGKSEDTLTDAAEGNPEEVKPQETASEPVLKEEAKEVTASQKKKEQEAKETSSQE